MGGNVYGVIIRRIHCFDVGNGICFSRQDLREYFLKILHAHSSGTDKDFFFQMGRRLKRIFGKIRCECVYTQTLAKQTFSFLFLVLTSL